MEFFYSNLVIGSNVSSFFIEKFIGETHVLNDISDWEMAAGRFWLLPEGVLWKPAHASYR